MDRVSTERSLSFPECAFVIIVLIFSTSITNAFSTVYFAGLPVHAYFWVAFYIAAGVILCLRNGIRWLVWVIRYRLLLVVVVLVAMASVSWSVDPILTLQRAIHLTGTTLIGCYIGFHVPPRTALSLLACALTFIIIGNTFVALAFPGVGQEDFYGSVVWKGWEFHRNGLGSTASIAVLFFAIRMLSVDVRSRWAYCAICVLSIVVLLKSKSATALVTVLAGAGIAISLYLANRLRLSGWITVLLLILLLLIMGVGAAVVFFAGEFGMLTGLVGRSADFTGRIPLWEMVWSLVKERPWLGFGYGGLWNPKPGTESPIGPLLEHQLGWLPPSAHNGFVNIASELGIPIAVIAALFSIQILIESLIVYLRRPSAFALLVVAILSALIVRMVSDQVLFTTRSLTWIMFVALPILSLRCSSAKRYIFNEAKPSK